MRAAISLLLDKGIRFTRPSEYQSKIGAWNYWPHKCKAHRDRDPKALVDIDPPKFLSLLEHNLAQQQTRLHVAANHLHPSIPPQAVGNWHKTLTTSLPHDARPLDVVRELIRNGVQVFPVHPGTKKPLTGSDRTAPNRWGATADATITLHRFMHLFPTAMIGVPTGQLNGLFAIDADRKLIGDTVVDGSTNFGKLIEANGGLPPTMRTLTKRGVHYLFDYAEGIRNSISKIAPGVDVRGEGGFVIWAGSIRADGFHYRRDPLSPLLFATAPDWLITAALTGHCRHEGHSAPDETPASRNTISLDPSPWPDPHDQQPPEPVVGGFGPPIADGQPPEPMVESLLFPIVKPLRTRGA